VVTAPGAESRRFVVMADAHLGMISSTGQWRRTLKAAAALEPDAVLIPGDLIDDLGSRTELQVAMMDELLPGVPVYMTTGNHDAYAGRGKSLELFRRMGFRLLRQEAEVISPGLTVARIDDKHFTNPHEAVSAMMGKLEGPTLLLTHRPATAKLLRNRPEILILAGHTHAGQMFPMTLLVHFGNDGFRAGLYEVGEACLYVTRGCGVWGPPMRILAPPELVLIEIRDGPRFAVR